MVDIEWSDCRLKSATITSERGAECRLRTNCVVSITCGGESVASRIENGVIIFDTEVDKKYSVKA